MIRKYTEIFCWKNVSSFCSAKATHIFSAKNIRILCIESAKTVNEMTVNELVKLTTLWTTGPRMIFCQCAGWSESVYFCMSKGTLFALHGPYVVFDIQSTLVISVQGTLWNTSRYPYMDKSDLQNWGKNKSAVTFNHIEYVIWPLML